MLNVFIVLTSVTPSTVSATELCAGTSCAPTISVIDLMTIWAWMASCSKDYKTGTNSRWVFDSPTENCRLPSVLPRAMRLVFLLDELVLRPVTNRIHLRLLAGLLLFASHAISSLHLPSLWYRCDLQDDYKISQ